MNTIGENKKDNLLLLQLKDILLSDDRLNVQQLQDILESYDLLSEKVSPIVEEHLHKLRNNYPNEFKTIVINLLEDRAQKVEKDVF